MDIILKYFKELSSDKVEKFTQLQKLYEQWNEQINVISRKDIESLYEKHILHSMAIAKFINFKPGTKIFDLGTGGGFPGIPLAILFPESEFLLCDSIAKKIKVVQNISEALNLKNVEVFCGRAENTSEKYHFITTRAVASSAQIYRWANKLIDQEHEINVIPNGFLLLKGGDLKEELKELKMINRKLHFKEHALSKWFDELFFETKKLIYIS